MTPTCKLISILTFGLIASAQASSQESSGWFPTNASVSTLGFDAGKNAYFFIAGGNGYFLRLSNDPSKSQATLLLSAHNSGLKVKIYKTGTKFWCGGDGYFCGATPIDGFSEIGSIQTTY